MKTVIVLFAAVLGVGAKAGAQEVTAEVSRPASTPLDCGAIAREGLATGPVALSFGTYGFSSPRRACHRSELSLAGGGRAIIDTPDFYGSLNGTAVLEGSYVLNRRWELFAAWEALSFQYAQNASLKKTGLGLGQLTVGGSWQWLQRGRWTLAPDVRFMLPTTVPSHGATVGGLLAGLGWQFRRVSWNAFHAYASAGVTSGLFATPALPRGTFSLSAGTELVPWDWFSVVIDLQTQFGQRAALDFLAPALELRFGGQNWGLSVAGGLPVVGDDRHDGLGQLKFAWRWD
jgi:hypothetical protein